MFKVGDYVHPNVNGLEGYVYIVTRIYNENYMAIAYFDLLDGFITHERKVKQKFFVLEEENDSTWWRNLYYLRKDCIGNYFDEQSDGTLILNHTEDTKFGLFPTWGLNINDPDLKTNFNGIDEGPFFVEFKGKLINR